MNKQQKAACIANYEDKISNAGFVILSEHGKMSVVAVENFRSELIEIGCEATVVKNTLAKIAFKNQGIEDISDYLAGTSLMLTGVEEIAPAAKALQKCSKGNKQVKVKAILFDGKVYPKEDFSLFTSMPTKDEVRAKLLSVMKAPISQFVTVINTPQRIVSVFKNYADKRSAS